MKIGIVGGGLAAAFDIAGTKLERFYHHVFSTDLDLLNLVDELGVQDKLAWYEENNGSWYEGAWHPFSTPKDILTFPPLGLLDRLRLGVGVKWMSMQKDHRPYEKVTARDWIRRVSGETVWKVVWEPLFRAKFGRHADEVAATWFYGRCTARCGVSKEGAPPGKLGYLTGSTQVIVDALEKRLKDKGVRIETANSVREITGDGDRVTGLVHKAGEEAFDRVLVTCATPLLLEMGRNVLPASLVSDLEQFRYHGSVIEVLEMNESLSPKYWMNILDSNSPFLAVIEHTNMVPREQYEGRVIVYLARYLDTDDEFYRLGKDETCAQFEAYLKKVFPDFNPDSVVRRHVMKARYTQPLVTMGYGQRIPPHRLPVGGLYLANMTQIYPQDRGMSYSVGLGRRVAKMLLEDTADHGN